MELTNKMQEVLKQHLPEMAAKELKDFIAQAETDKKALQATLEDKKKMEAELLELKGLRSKYDQAESIYEKARLSADATAQKELRMEVEILKCQLEAQKQIASQSREFMALMARNPRAIEIMTHFQSENQAGYMNGGNYVQPSPMVRNETKITESKETKSDNPHE